MKGLEPEGLITSCPALSGERIRSPGTSYRGCVVAGQSDHAHHSVRSVFVLTLDVFGNDWSFKKELIGSSVFFFFGVGGRYGSVFRRNFRI